ncbi:MAG: methyltransferase domain-containing protein [Chitinivibrionales bacterium]|nr:methyltransferase domain-containing protein [Chitinivibrionales bacterium]
MTRSAYSQAVKSGRYAEGCGLRGKYDHVRTRWEDALTAQRIAPFVSSLTARKRAASDGVRVLELGCGAGDGVAFLTKVADPAAPLAADARACLPIEAIGAYRGIDINEDLLAEARERFTGCDSFAFEMADISQGLPAEPGEAPYDIYFTSFGTLSHLHDGETERLLRGIADHADPGAVVVCDWLGRYSYEWQDLWRQGSDREQWMDYRISYIYSEEERREREIESFPLKLVGGSDVDRMLAAANEGGGKRLVVRTMFDRSTLIGRHMETGEYNGNPMLLREAVNSLWEPGLRTDLRRLVARYRPREGFETQNDFFGRLFDSWNSVVEHAQGLWAGDIQPGGAARQARAGHDDDPATALCDALEQSLSAAQWYAGDDLRADVLEPQLAAVLRTLEARMQPGWGSGHGIVAICEVENA